MKDEPLPEPINRGLGPDRISPVSVGGATMVEMICEEEEML